MKQLIIALAIGWSGIVSAQIQTMPTIPVDPRCGQVFCPPLPPNPCTVDPELCKPKKPVPLPAPAPKKCWIPEGCPSIKCKLEDADCRTFNPSPPRIGPTKE